MNADETTQIRLVRPDELPAFVAVHNAYWPDLSVSVEQLRRDDQELAHDQRERRWVAWDGSTAIGFGFAQQTVGAGEGYWFASVGVQENYRRRGIGSRLLAEALNTAQELGPVIKIDCQIREDDSESIRFAHERSFFEERRVCFSILDLSDFDREPVDVGEIRIAQFADLDSVVFRRSFHDLFEEIRVDLPRTSPPKRFKFDEFDRLVLGDPNLIKDATFVALDGDQLVGFTSMFDNAREGFVDQWVTGVRRSYRGRRIAKALKSRQLAWAKANSLQYIQTDNDSQNVAMLAVNEWLGFEPQPALITASRQFWGCQS